MKKDSQWSAPEEATPVDACLSLSLCPKRICPVCHPQEPSLLSACVSHHETINPLWHPSLSGIKTNHSAPGTALEGGMTS